MSVWIMFAPVLTSMLNSVKKERFDRYTLEMLSEIAN
jgi:hypothetical protein